jgi:hypothetical protein
MTFGNGAILIALASGSMAGAGMKRRIIVALFACGASCIVLQAQTNAQSCDKAMRDAGSAVLAAQHQLMLQKAKEAYTDVSLATKNQIAAFKDTLVAATDSVLKCEAATQPAPGLQADIARLFDANKPEKPGPPTDAKAKIGDDFAGLFGGGLTVKVSAPASRGEIRTVELGFDIQCGVDTMLLVYEKQAEDAQGFKRTLRWQAPPYDEVSGAFGDFFEYVLLPGSDAEPWRLVVAHGTPWCTSRWSGYKIDLLEPIVGAPHVAWHYEQGYVRLENEPRLSEKPGGFELRLDVGTIEGDQLVRKGVFRYAVDGDTVRRVQPIAVDGRGFVDEWLQSPWSEAKDWSLPEGLAGFEKAHKNFAAGRKDGKITYSYGPVRSCSMKGQFEVEIDADPGGTQFYQIRETGNGYTMVNFGTTQDERCSGPDIMRKH